MTRLQSVLSFLALPAEEQVELLHEIPYDRGEPDYYTALDQNPILLLVRGVVEDASQPEAESDAEYFARTGMRPDSTALDEMCCFVYLLRHHFASDDYWTQRAMVGKAEWRLLRRLAGLALAEAGCTLSCSQQDIHDAIRSFRAPMFPGDS